MARELRRFADEGRYGAENRGWTRGAKIIASGSRIVAKQVAMNTTSFPEFSPSLAGKPCEPANAR